MAAKEVSSFLEYGNIINSINFPSCEMPPSSNERIIIANKNIPNMVGQITTLLARELINISDMINKHREELAYTVIDVDDRVGDETIQKISDIEGILMIRTL